MRRLLALTILLLPVTEGNGQTCRFGVGCRYDCNCAGFCNPQTGCVGNCARGWDGPTCQRRNVALDQRSSQSSTWSQYTSGLAVDGKVGHTLETTKCTHTQDGNQSWWMARLNRAYSIYGFQIYNRKGNCNKEPNWQCGSRLNGFTVSVGTNNQNYSTCYADTTTSDYGPGDIINGTCDDVCNLGWYGSDCAEECGFCSPGRSFCDRTSGHFPIVSGQARCMLGYTGVICKTPCVDGRYGLNCAQKCGWCNQGRSCNSTSGHCPNASGQSRCMAGYKAAECKMRCSSGSWGDNCVNSCSENCVNPACNVTSGACAGGCHPGYTGERCDADCPTGSWGDNCVSKCSDNCLEQPCNVQTGACEGGCQPGYAGKFCETEFSVTSVDYTNVIIGCVVGVTMTAVLVTAVVLYVRRRQTGRSEGTTASAENIGVTKDMPHPEPSSRTQGTDTDPVTYYNMASEEHPYETVPEKEYDKMRFSRLDTDTDTNYTTLT